MVATLSPSVGFLNNLLSGQTLSPVVDEYLRENLVNYPGSWYNQVLRKDGKEAAEKALAEYAKKNYLYEFSEAIRPTVAGLKDLTEADKEEKHVRLLRTGNDGSKFIARRFGSSSQLLVAFNPEHHGCGCDTPEGYWAFGLNGTLGLRAVVLGISYGREVILGLVLPNRDKEADPLGEGFKMICLNLAGHLYNDSLSPKFRRDDFLRQELGLIGMENAISILTYAGGSEDMCMGFPGSADYLAKHIGTLGTYLSSTAAKLKSHKTKKH